MNGLDSFGLVCEQATYVTELCGPLHDAQLQMVELDRA